VRRGAGGKKEVRVEREREREPGMGNFILQKQFQTVICPK
jgi:hypothetical protein